MRKNATKALSLLCVLALMLAVLAACGSQGDGSQQDDAGSADAVSDRNSADEAEPESVPDWEVEPEVPEMGPAATIAVGALKGPTGMGMAPLMDRAERGETQNDYLFTLDSAPDIIQGKLVSGELDIAALPTNVASVLYERTEGGVQLLAINTLGVLYIVQGPEAGIESIEDLAGKTIHSAGQGSTQEYVINHLLTQAGMADSVSVEYHGEHAEVATLLLSGDIDVALLPEPQVTNAVLNGEGVSVALDVTAEWERQSDGVALVMGCLVIRTEFLEENREAVGVFLEEYRASTEYVNENIDEAAEIIGGYDIVAAQVARVAIPNCNIVCVTGEEMAASARVYLEALAEQNLTAVGGSLPDDGFYYIP